MQAQSEILLSISQVGVPIFFIKDRAAPGFAGHNSQSSPPNNSERIHLWLSCRLHQDRMTPLFWRNSVFSQEDIGTIDIDFSSLREAAVNNQVPLSLNPLAL